MARPALRLTDTDRGWHDVQQQVIKLSQHGHYTLVGVQGRDSYTTHTGNNRGLTVVEIAQIHEYGKVINNGRATIIIPRRSWLRDGVDEYKVALQKRATLLGTGVILLKFTAFQALSLLGEYSVGLIKQRIADGIPPPNAPSTIRRKKSSKPLIDTGQLRNAITYTVERAR